jgi:hypothetical protein
METQLDSILRDILQRPGMYIGEPSVIRLRSFLDGYVHALCEATADKSSVLKLQAFRDWIYKKYSITESLGWEQVLINATGSDRRAFAICVQLWIEFGREHERAANKSVNPSGGSGVF